MKEFGGYLPFELRDGEELYKGENVVALNCARYGIVYSIQDGKYSKLYIPFYMCDTVKDALIKYNIDFATYHFDESFYPIDVKLEEHEAILYPNYFGLCSEEKCKWVVNTYKNVIFDNTQAFYAKPVLDVYNVYSCRKFLGVSDGAYVVHRNIIHKELDSDMSWNKISYLFKCIEESTDSAYEDSLRQEQILSDSPMLAMSSLTHRILAGADYNKNKEARRNNYRLIHDKVSEYNDYAPVLLDENVPMVYPFCFEDESLRKRLIQKYHIYIPQWWKVLLDRPGITEFEEKMARYLLPLPIDMRYGQETTEEMTDLIIQELL